MKKYALLLCLITTTALASTYYTGTWGELSNRQYDKYNGLKCLATNAGTVSSTCGGANTTQPWCKNWLLRYDLVDDRIMVGGQVYAYMTIQGVRIPCGGTDPNCWVVQRFGYSGGQLNTNAGTCVITQQPGTATAALTLR